MLLVALFYTGSCLEEQSIGCRPCIYACRVGYVCKCGQCVPADQPTPRSGDIHHDVRDCGELLRRGNPRGTKIGVDCPYRGPNRRRRPPYRARAHMVDRCMACPRSCTFRGFGCDCKGNCDFRSRRHK
jgi:hypothetical protein